MQLKIWLKKHYRNLNLKPCQKGRGDIDPKGLKLISPKKCYLYINGRLIPQVYCFSIDKSWHNDIINFHNFLKMIIHYSM